MENNAIIDNQQHVNLFTVWNQIWHLSIDINILPQVPHHFKTRQAAIWLGYRRFREGTGHPQLRIFSISFTSTGL